VPESREPAGNAAEFERNLLYGEAPALLRRAKADLMARHQLEQPPAAPVLEHPDRTVRALGHGAHAPAHVVARGFTRRLAIELDANQGS
jgi:hypothetical protein